MQDLVLSLRRTGTTTLIVHHSGKGGQQRGTSRREDVLDTVISLRRPEGYEAPEGARFEVHFEKSRGFTGGDAIPFEASLQVGDDCAIRPTTVARRSALHRERHGQVSAPRMRAAPDPVIRVRGGEG
jgi:hypothetical protein